jgi:hypothetical protein
MCLDIFKFANNQVEDVPIETQAQIPESGSKFEQAKSMIFGEGPALVANMLTMGTLVILSVVKDWSTRNFQSANHDSGRIMIFTAKNLLPAIIYFLFPLLVILNNKKMKKSLFKDLKEISSTQPCH